jgi:hypothetical protein
MNVQSRASLDKRKANRMTPEEIAKTPHDGYQPAPMGDWTPRAARSRKASKKGYGTKDRIKRAKLATGRK